MSYVVSEKSITHRVLNDSTGELEAKQFSEVKTRKNIKGGFSMVYNNYDEAVGAIVKSQLDFKLVVYIRKLFTYKKIEVSVSSTRISKDLGVGKSKVDSIVKRMVEVNLLKRVHRGVYRLNPYMYLPMNSNGESMQSEWVELKPK